MDEPCPWGTAEASMCSLQTMRYVGRSGVRLAGGWRWLIWREGGTVGLCFCWCHGGCASRCRGRSGHGLATAEMVVVGGMLVGGATAMKVLHGCSTRAHAAKPKTMVVPGARWTWPQRQRLIGPMATAVGHAGPDPSTSWPVRGEAVADWNSIIWHAVHARDESAGVGVRNTAR
jgi:hypothetical protein